MKKVSLLFLASLISAFSFSQSASSYDDVAVIMNSNSDASVEIGTYFAQQREIPDENLIYVVSPLEEEVDTNVFNDIAGQIEQALIDQGIVDRINYLVTTKGVPVNLRIADSCEGISGSQNCLSFGQALSLITSPYEHIIGTHQYIENPYFDAWEKFSREEFEIFIVSHLDAYTVDRVKEMIDRTGPKTLVNKDEAQIIFDVSYIDDTNLLNLFERILEPATEFMIRNEWNYVFDTDTLMITNAENVLGYYSMNFNPFDKTIDFDWLNGSFATNEIGNNFSFYDSLNTDNRLLLPDVLEDGATSASAYVNVTFLSLGINIERFYERYLNDSLDFKFNLAESYYAGLKKLASQYLLVGDPKTSLLISHTGFDEKPVISGISVFPNPVEDEFSLEFSSRSEGEINIRIVDLKGRVISSRFHEQAEGINRIRMDASDIPQGIYAIILGDEKGYRFSKKLVKF